MYDKGKWDFQYMFSGCSSLKKFVIITKWNKKNNEEDTKPLEQIDDKKYNSNDNNEDDISMNNLISDENENKISFNFYNYANIYFYSSQKVSLITKKSLSTSCILFSSKYQKENIIHISNIIFMFHKCYSLTILKGLFIYI